MGETGPFQETGNANEKPDKRRRPGCKSSAGLASTAYAPAWQSSSALRCTPGPVSALAWLTCVKSDSTVSTDPLEDQAGGLFLRRTVGRAWRLATLWKRRARDHCGVVGCSGIASTIQSA
ncbi:hypothetical protein N7539_004476 [Penicillium diatomitis]|uniref:Uncharacterized protein n=1 Tax=Penicillium diatomitis TaxID=2819901 RepID=A0A9W9XE64_9EURO|nr:uncharacterized protein N7539_004476 [Penicillium diatomitis]KAJ5489586.1 hypothetical protein N7539_004476 [Penicillium diatomitis]